MKRLREWSGVLVGPGAWLLLASAGSSQETTPSDKAKIEAGETVYNSYCAPCHGDNLVSSGQFPNLRRLTAGDRAKFDGVVRNGRNQMPPWKGVLSDEQIDQIWAYIRSVADR